MKNKLNQPIEEKCGYCRKVQKNRGGNRGYQCARHRKRVTMKSVKFYTQEHIENLLEQERERIRTFLKDSSVWDAEYIYHRKSLLLEKYDSFINPSRYH